MFRPRTSYTDPSPSRGFGIRCHHDVGKGNAWRKWLFLCEAASLFVLFRSAASLRWTQGREGARSVGLGHAGSVMRRLSADGCVVMVTLTR